MLVFQDTMDLLHHPRTAGDRGTLEQVRNFFGHRSVKHNVMANYQHVADLLEVRVSYLYGQLIFLSMSTKGVVSINNFIFLFQYDSYVLHGYHISRVIRNCGEHHSANFNISYTAPTRRNNKVMMTWKPFGKALSTS